MAKRRQGDHPEKILAYGLEKLGFRIPEREVVGQSFRVEWRAYDSPDPVSDADGIIIPQGIFETMELSGGLYPFTKVSCDDPLMLQREREIINLMAAGGWVCFLVGLVIDEPASASRDASGTDLCKRLMNVSGVRREPLRSPATWIQPVQDEFRAFLKKYGIAKTGFQGPSTAGVLAKDGYGGSIVALEVASTLFLLPFHTINARVAEDVVSLVADAVVSYRRKVRVTVPEWVKGFAFRVEESLLRRKGELVQQLGSLEQSLAEWTSYKTVLVTSGELLKVKVISILTNYFALNVNPIDELREDFKIVGFDEGHRIEAVAECKGTKSGIKREYINQVDSHRERSELGLSTPGLLIINNEMGVESLEGRAKTIVAPEQVRHAHAFNVLVVRSIDLLWLMVLWESKPPRERGDEFLGLLGRGGGWLRVGPDGLTVETGLENPTK